MVIDVKDVETGKCLKEYIHEREYNDAMEAWANIPHDMLRVGHGEYSRSGNIFVGKEKNSKVMLNIGSVVVYDNEKIHDIKHFSYIPVLEENKNGT